ncbi:MAG: outer membrane beta-barrel protein [Sphingobacteriaceae bacterium]|nr:outer membrane beta-barrel protein [Sphingobacteriaceae bacterium]
MKAKNLIVVLLFLSCFSFSQEKDPNKGWYVGPNISYSAISGYYNNQFGFDNSFNYKPISYSLGADWLYAFGRKHTLNFGIHYGETKFSSTYYWPLDSLYNPDKISTYIKSTSQYLVLPVHMNFCLLKGNISPYVMTGLAVGISIGGRSFSRTTYVNGKVEEMRANGYSRSHLDLLWQLGIGVDVNLDKKRFRVFVYDSGDGPILLSALAGQTWRYSIHTGISYYFKTSRR